MSSRVEALVLALALGVGAGCESPAADSGSSDDVGQGESAADEGDATGTSSAAEVEGTAGDGDGTTGDGDATTGDGDATTGDGDGTTGDGTTGDGDGTLAVLYIGNSYTAFNDLPQLVSTLAEMSGSSPTITHQRITPGGTRFVDHYSTATTLAAIDQGGWDYVVLQGQSLEPILDPAGFQTYGQLLGERACDVGASVAYFETWARDAGHDFYSWGYAATPDEAQALYRARYEALADSVPCAFVARVGDAWQATWTADPQISLYTPDGSHPTLEGSYLGALVFWATLTGGSPLGVWSPSGVDPVDATALQGHAASASP